jgi:hypothetical protein
MTAIGFSTGALAKGDFKLALSLLREHDCKIVELSALRDHELPKIVGAMNELDLSHFQHVSFHAPSTFQTLSEQQVIEFLKEVLARKLPIVLHPDAIQDFSAWRMFGNSLLIENMDKRKKTGRTVRELESIFKLLPEARMCFDIAHARQVDPTMSQAALILKQFGSKVAQVHLSEVDIYGRHTKLTMASTFAYPRVLPLIDQRIPVIIESMVAPEEITSELRFATDLWVQGASRSGMAAT